MFHLTRVVKCLIESWLMNNGDQNDSESFADSDDAQMLLKLGGVIIKYYEGGEFQKVQYDPLKLSRKTYYD